eukprot:gene2072-20694_t
MVRIAVSVERIGNEWVMLELQGTVETVDKGARFDGGSLGTLHYDKSSGAPVLEVGHHQVKGKEVKLKKTLAVMKKQEGELTEEGTNTSYDVIALIKKKIIFMTRPHSLIGGAHKGLSTVIKA